MSALKTATEHDKVHVSGQASTSEKVPKQERVSENEKRLDLFGDYSMRKAYLCACNEQTSD
ncbi:MAG: hypothetical protein ACI4C3_00695 [Bacteroides sp.]